MYNLTTDSPSLEVMPPGRGEMGDLIRDFDWATTPLGAIETWPSCLKTVVSVVLANQEPMLVLWGPDLRTIYNDGFSTLLGDHQERMLGAPISLIDAKLNTTLAALAFQVLAGGRGARTQHVPLPTRRNGFLEETYFTFSCNPTGGPPESPAGVLVNAFETTAQVRSERQMRTLQGLGARTYDVQRPEDACRAAASILEHNPADVPFALFYLCLEGQPMAQLVAHTAPPGNGLGECPIDVPFGESNLNPFATAFHELAHKQRSMIGLDLLSYLGDKAPLQGSKLSEEGLVLPLGRSVDDAPLGFLVLTPNPRRPLDASYKEFFSAVAELIGGQIASAEAYKREQAARKDAELANRTKDEFLAMLGHELRNPLSPIVTSLQLLRMRGTEFRELQVMERQVGHLVRLVDDLLDIARITQGRVELRKEPLEIGRVIRRAVEMASPLLDRRAQRLDIQVTTDGGIVRADPARLSQVLSNLLMNASKFSDPGSKIWLSASRQDDWMQLAVRDEGVGIAPPMLGRVFDSFVQGRQSIDRASGGLGLGLAIVRSLVKLHGGRVYARSEGLGKGSEFVVDLPLDLVLSDAPTPTPRRGLPIVPSDASVQSTRILVVDDNDDAAAMLAEALEDVGYEVQVAHDGPSAMVAATKFHPNVALLDIGLPVMDGYELAQRLRASDGALRLIAVTGYGQEEDRRRSKEAGFAAHLVKPVSLDVLTKVVHS